ncbi:MAG: hypothetical protein RR229_00950 [Oscillospiraceae bacterium]
MSKESKAQKISNDTDANNETKHLAFFEVFSNAFTCLLAIVLVYSVVYIAFFKPKTQNTNIMLDNVFTTSAAVTSPKNETPPASGNANSATKDDGKTENTKATTSASAAAKPAVKTPTTTAEIATYYKNAVNKVKKSSKSVLCPWKTTTNYKGIVETGSSEFLANAIRAPMEKNLKPTVSNTPYTTRDDIKNKFPPAATVSNLKVTDIKSATCAEKGNYYYISIDINGEVDPKPGFGIGSVFNILTEQTINSASPIKISNVHTVYDSGHLDAKIEKSTGNMVNLSTKLPSVLQLTALGFNCKLGLQYEEKWEISW